MQFKDHFSTRSRDYAQFRPHYPIELFEYLAGLAPARLCAWDCATGNGQAAAGLAHCFQNVVATDASEEQIANAIQHERVQYRVATAEQSDIESASIDIVIVAQALHWFDVGLFFDEVRRVLKPGGALAVWCYNLLEVSPPIDALLEKFYRETVGPYWDFERSLVETGYRTLPFPFTEIESPSFQMKADWSLDQLLGYLRTWSATKNFILERGFDPVAELAGELSALWGPVSDRKRISWPLSLRVGRLSI